MTLKELQKLREYVDVTARLFPFVAISCLIWYEIDPNIETIYAKTHLIITGVFAVTKIIDILK